MSKKPKGEPRVERAKCLNGEVASVPSDSDGEASFPLLFDMLCPRYKDGTMTKLGAILSLKAVGSTFRVSITAPTEAVATVIYVASLSTLFAEIETKLGNGGAIWVPDYETEKRARQALRR